MSTIFKRGEGGSAEEHSRKVEQYELRDNEGMSEACSEMSLAGTGGPWGKGSGR